MSPEVLLVVHGREALSIGVALVQGSAACASGIGSSRRFSAGTDEDLRRAWHDLGAARARLQRPRQIAVLAVLNPALGNRDDGFTLLPDAAKVQNEITNGVECETLPAPADHFPHDLFAVHRRHVTFPILVFFRIRVGNLESPAPDPVVSQGPLEHLRLASERQVRGRHLRRHDADQIFLADHAVHQSNERSANVVGALDRHVIRVQKDDEHACARVFRHLVALALRVRFRTRLLRSGRTDDDVFEGFDLLRHAVFEQLEVGGRQVRYGNASGRRKDVDAHEIGFRPERRLGLLRREADGREGNAREAETDPGCQRSRGKGHLVVRALAGSPPQCTSGITT